MGCVGNGQNKLACYLVQMNYNDSITGGEMEEKEKRAEAHLKAHSVGDTGSTRSLSNRIKTYFTALEHTNPHHPFFRARRVISIVWIMLLTYVILPAHQLVKFLRCVCVCMCVYVHVCMLTLTHNSK